MKSALSEKPSAEFLLPTSFARRSPDLPSPRGYSRPQELGSRLVNVFTLCFKVTALTASRQGEYRLKSLLKHLARWGCFPYRMSRLSYMLSGRKAPRDSDFHRGGSRNSL